jgi:hypothetical protein
MGLSRSARYGVSRLFVAIDFVPLINNSLNPFWLGDHGASNHESNRPGIFPDGIPNRRHFCGDSCIIEVGISGMAITSKLAVVTARRGVQTDNTESNLDEVMGDTNATNLLLCVCKKSTVP